MAMTNAVKGLIVSHLLSDEMGGYERLDFMSNLSKCWHRESRLPLSRGTRSYHCRSMFSVHKSQVLGNGEPVRRNDTCTMNRVRLPPQCRPEVACGRSTSIARDPSTHGNDCSTAEPIPGQFPKLKLLETGYRMSVIFLGDCQNQWLYKYC